MNITRLSGVLLAVALPFAVTGVASASTDTSFTLIVSVPGGATEVVGLACEPTGGPHPNAKSACRELHAAQGNFDKLADDQEPTFCTMEYRPVVAIAYGTWHGQPVFWGRKFSNDCTLHSATGTVFRF